MLLGFLYLYVVLLFGFCGGQSSPKYCSVCRVLVSEAEWVISQVDPKKSIQVGSFRVDPKGNQKMKDKQYARSELHIEEIIESVCEKTGYYAEVTLDDGKTQMVRTIGFDGKRLETKGINLDTDKGNAFRYKCESFLEDHEEDLILHLQRQNILDSEKEICGEKLGVCSLDELSVPMFTLPEAEDYPSVSEADPSDQEEDESDSESDVSEDGADKGSDDLPNPPSAIGDEKTEL